MLKETLDNLSASDVVDVRRSVIGVVLSYFASLRDQLPVFAATIAESDNRLTSEKVSQWIHQCLVCRVASSYCCIAPSTCLTSRRLSLRLAH